MTYRIEILMLTVHSRTELRCVKTMSSSHDYVFDDPSATIGIYDLVLTAALVVGEPEH